MKRTFWKKALTFALSAALAVSASAVAFAEGTCTCTTKCTGAGNTSCTVCSVENANLVEVCGKVAPDADGVVHISNSAQLIYALHHQADNQTWELAPGEYDVKDYCKDIDTNGSDAGGTGYYFPITASNLHIIGDDEQGVTIKSSVSVTTQGGNGETQTFMEVWGDNVTIEGVKIQSFKNHFYFGTNDKAIQIGGKNFTLRNVELLDINDPAATQGQNSGRVYFNSTDMGTSTLENVTMCAGIRLSQEETGELILNNVVQDYTNNLYSGEQKKDYNSSEKYSHNPGVGRWNNGRVTVKMVNDGLTILIDDNLNFANQLCRDHLPDGTVIKLAANVTQSINIPEGVTATLDLNGYSITNTTAEHTISNHGTLTIKDSGTAGKVDNKSHGKGALVNYPEGTVILDGGTFDRSLENGDSSSSSGGNSWYTIKNLGNMTINQNVHVTTAGGKGAVGKFSSLINTGWYNDPGAIANDLGLTYTSGNPSLIINGGTFDSGLNTVKNDDYGILEINGGVFKNNTQSVIMNFNIATINAGDFIPNSVCRATILNTKYNDVGDKGELKITGGTFRGTDFVKARNDSETVGPVVITGGYYEMDVDGYCDNGYTTGNKKATGADGNDYYQVHQHVTNLSATPAKEATCTEGGNKAYWECKVCHKLFADVDATIETTLKDVTIPPNGHTLTKVDAEAATCTKDGSIAHWKCSVCDKLFTDENATTETTLEAVTLSKLGHKLTKYERVEPTCVDPGREQYWLCTVCDKLFADEATTKETTENALTIDPLGHKMTKYPAVAATTEKEGNLEYYVCENEKNVWYWDAEGKNLIANHNAVVTAKLTSQTEELKSEVGKPEETFEVPAEGSATPVEVKIDTDKLMENTADTMASADTSSELKQNAVKELAKEGVTVQEEDVTLILTPAVEVDNVKVDEDKATITMEISLVCKVEAKAGSTVVPVAKQTVPNDQIKQDTVITMSVPASWNGKSIIVRHETKNRGVKFYSAVAANGVATFTVPAEDGFSPFTLFVDDGATVTVKLDNETKTYNRTDVVNETALPAPSKYNYAFKGWKFEGIDHQHFNMTAWLFEELLDKNAVVVGSSVFEGPLSEHPEIEEAKKNGTWGVDENKPAATAKPAAAAAVTPVRSSIPKTSDDSNLMLWVCLMGLAALGLGGAVYMKKRNHQ